MQKYVFNLARDWLTLLKLVHIYITVGLGAAPGR